MSEAEAPEPRGLWSRLVAACIDHSVVVWVLVALLVGAGLHVSPFELGLGDRVARDPVPVDAIPDTGENQQIVFTRWEGRSPKDIEDQITYPLTTALLGVPGVRTVRSASAFGFSTIYVVFDDDVEFYWSRARLLEKLSALPAGTLPEGVSPTLGPDATALGQIFWYTLEGHSPDGEVVGGFDLDELRSVQDWTVRYALQSVPGVAEVASVGGFTREYQVDVDPVAMRAHGVTLGQVAAAVRESNLDVGARTLEINSVEYVVRGLGFVRSLADLEATVVTSRDHTPIRIRDVAHVSLGPALRRGALDDAGAPAVGGVVVARFMENPRAVIDGVKAKLAELQPGLPTRVLPDGTRSQVTVVPFYDRTALIEETLGTLSSALLQQMLICVIVVLALLRSLRSSALISLTLPLAVGATFVMMKVSGVTANIMALGGIAIAIGSMVDIGVVFVENVHQHLALLPAGESRARRRAAVRDAAAEVAPAVWTSVLTTVVSFLPVFGLSEGDLRLFAPLALTKTFAMGAAVVLAVTVLPGASLWLLRRPARGHSAPKVRPLRGWRSRHPLEWALLALVTLWLADAWLPLGPGAGLFANALFVGCGVFGLLYAMVLFERHYPRMLRAALDHRRRLVSLPIAVVVLGLTVWLGFESTFGFLPRFVRESAAGAALGRTFPGLGREYMPGFDEGAFLYMPTTMPHASIGESLRMLSAMDAAIAQVPEVDRVVGKLGRVESALDPAPVSMFETVVTYLPEYGEDDQGERVRNWRDHIRSPQDIWNAIVAAAERPGVTSAPLLMPIEARQVMLQSGMRAPMGVKVRGPDLATIEAFGLRLERALSEVPELRPESVFADRVVGKPYLEIDIDRNAIGRYGLSVADVQEVLSVALGGMPLTLTVEGRERYPVRVRYMREERDSLEALERVFVPAQDGEPVPLSQLADFRYVRGPQVIKSEDTFLTSYVLFDRQPEVAEVEAVRAAQHHLQRLVQSGELRVPEGVSYAFAGTYENQVRSEARLRLLIPVALALVFVLLYLQFKRVVTAAVIFSGVAVSVCGGFVLLWLYAQPWFLHFSVGGMPMQELFRVAPVHLSVAVWVGFIALVGLATDDGVVLCTYLRARFQATPPESPADVRAHTLEASARRVRPCLMTTATTLLALLPVVTSQGRGADLMAPMALPMLGGMAFELTTLFLVPVLYCSLEERALKTGRGA